MIDTIELYIFAVVVVSAITMLSIVFIYEKHIKEIERQERIKGDPIPIYLVLQIARAFSKTHPIVGSIYLCIWYYLLGSGPVIFVLMVLQALYPKL